MNFRETKTYKAIKNILIINFVLMLLPLAGFLAEIITEKLTFLNVLSFLAIDFLCMLPLSVIIYFIYFFATLKLESYDKRFKTETAIIRIIGINFLPGLLWYIGSAVSSLHHIPNWVSNIFPFYGYVGLFFLFFTVPASVIYFIVALIQDLIKNNKK